MSKLRHPVSIKSAEPRQRHLLRRASRLVPVGVVAGRPFMCFGAILDPSAYDAANGGHGAAKSVLEKLVSTLIDADGDAFLRAI